LPQNGPKYPKIKMEKALEQTLERLIDGAALL
jgi:hypothetical protein